MDANAPGSLVTLRPPAALLLDGGVVATALIARELGGGRRAQVLAAGAFAVSAFLAMMGRYLITSTVDVALTTVATRLLGRRRPLRTVWLSRRFTAAPAVVWQATNDWPVPPSRKQLQFEMSSFYRVRVPQEN